METIFVLSHNGATIFQGTESGCYFELQRKQSSSAQHAIRYEGWKVSPIEVTKERAKEILKADRWMKIDAVLLEDYTTRHWLKIRLSDGKGGKSRSERYDL